MRVGDHQPGAAQAAQAATDQALQERRPESLCLRRPDVQANDLALAIGVHRDCDCRGHTGDATALTLFEVSGIQPEIGLVADQRTIQEGVYPVVDVAAQLADGAFADACQSHGLHQAVDTSGRHAANPVDPFCGSTLNDGHQGLLRHAARLQERGEVASAYTVLINEIPPRRRTLPTENAGNQPRHA